MRGLALTTSPGFEAPCAVIEKLIESQHAPIGKTAMPMPGSWL
jgi:hypothetical protein